MGACSDGPPILEQLKKNLLSDFFRDGCVMEEVKGDAVDHTLMFANDGLKVGLCHLPSPLITIEEAISTQNLFGQAGRLISLSQFAHIHSRLSVRNSVFVLKTLQRNTV